MLPRCPALRANSLGLRAMPGGRTLGRLATGDNARAAPTFSAAPRTAGSPWPLPCHGTARGNGKQRSPFRNQMVSNLDFCDKVLYQCGIFHLSLPPEKMCRERHVHARACSGPKPQKRVSFAFLPSPPQPHASLFLCAGNVPHTFGAYTMASVAMSSASLSARRNVGGAVAARKPVRVTTDVRFSHTNAFIRLVRLLGT